MSKISLFVFIIFFGIVSVQAQANKEVESLVFRNETKYPKQKDLLLKYLDKTFYENLNQTLSFSEYGARLGFENKDSAFAGTMLSYHGRANYFSGDYDKAAVDFYRAIAILKSVRDQKSLAGAYNDLAKLYRKTRNLELAMENYDAALNIYTLLKDSTGIGMILNESGVVFEYKKEYKKAIERYEASKAIAEKLNDSLGVSYSLSFIGLAYSLQGKYAAAEKLLLQALEIRKALNSKLPTALILADLGNVMLMKGDYAKARNYLTQSNTIAFALNYDQLMADNYEMLAETAQKMGDFKSALEYFKKGIGIKDSIYTLQKTKQIDELSTQYQTQKKEHQIRYLSEKIKQKNIVLAAVIVVIILASLLVWSFFRRRKLKAAARLNMELMKHRQQVAQVVIETGEKERQRIAQELHDGVGQLLSASKMKLSAFENQVENIDNEEKKSLEQIVKLVDDSCREVRSVSHNMMASVLVKNSLDRALQEMIEPIQSDHLAIHLFTEGVVQKMDFNWEIMLYRIIQECLNNIIKHSKATVVDITLIKDAQEISLTIEDNGIGFSLDHQKGSGVGLQSIKARVAYMEGTLEINAQPGAGTVVSIHIPLKTNVNA